MDNAVDVGGAEHAFETLRVEVAALREAIERQATSDHTLTIGTIVKELPAVGTWLDAIEDAAPLHAALATIAQQILGEAERLPESHAARAQPAQEGFKKGQDTLRRVA